MKKLKFIAITLANYVPVLCACLFYKGGAPVEWSLYIMLQIILIVLNYKFSNKRLDLSFFNANLFISTIIANVLGTYLYYCNVSSDPETPIVGELGLIVGAIFVFILSLISILLKRKKSE